jgi:hypothetical protein
MLPSRFYTGSDVNKRDRYEQLRASMWSERSSFDSHWRELSDWMLPRRSRWFAGDRNQGDRRNGNIIDSTARFAARTLQSGLHAGLTSPARPWFKLTTPDPLLAEFKPVQEWLHLVTQRMQIVLADSNLYNTLPTTYGDLGVFGTAAMSILEDSKDLLRCYSYPIGSYALGLDSRNVVNTFAREYELSVRQIVEEFGIRRGYRDIDWSGISPQVKALWDKGNYEASVELCWIVMPNPDADATKLEARYLPFTSCHYEKGENREGRFLRESGYRTFPILAPRWDVTGEDTYGTDCPGMTALGDVKGLQIEQKEKGKAIAKGVNPPLVGAPELRSQKTSLLPGDITFVREPQHGLRAIHDIAINLQHLTQDIAQVQYRIQRAFYEDLFLMLAQSDQIREGSQPITAREVQERHEEKLLALGPVLERTNDELLDPSIDRTYHLMETAGMVPDAPPELEGVALKVEYISIMQQAQKLTGVAAQDRFLNTLLPMAEIYPEVRHKVKIFRVINNYGDMLGVDPNILRSDEEAQQLLDQERAAQQKQAEAEQAQLLARATKDAATAPMGTDSALDRLAGNLGTVQ